MATEQVCQVVCVWTVMALYCKKDGHFYHVLHGLIADSQAPLEIQSGADTSQGYWIHGLVRYLWNNRYRVQGLLRGSFAFMDLSYSNSVCEPSWCRLIATIIVGIRLRFATKLVIESLVCMHQGTLHGSI